MRKLLVLLTLVPFLLLPAAARATDAVLMGDQAVASMADSNRAGMAQAFEYTATTSGTSSDAELYVRSGTTANSVSVGVYDDAGGRPGNLLASGSLSSPQVQAWNDVTVPGATLTKGQIYWIALLPIGGQVSYQDTAGGSGASYVESDFRLTSLPQTYASASEYNVSPASIYLTGTSGTVAAPANTVPPVVSGIPQEGSTLT